MLKQDYCTSEENAFQWWDSTVQTRRLFHSYRALDACSDWVHAATDSTILEAIFFSNLDKIGSLDT